MGIGMGTCVFAGASYLAVASVTVTRTVGVPGSLHVTSSASGCDNSPGPTITLTGELTLGGLDARLIFRNADKGPHVHTEDVNVDITVLEPGEVLSFAKQPPLGGVGGNPYIYLELFDEDWNSISDRVFLGRCVQGLSPENFEFLHLTDLDVDVSGNCSNNPGPFISLEGEISIGGINAILSFQNSAHNPPHVHVDFVILESGETISFAKQPPLGGVGGNPKIWLQFLDDSGSPVSGEIFIGKCNSL
jgi:hypothetical protein